jgi:hypothetical protein
MKDFAEIQQEAKAFQGGGFVSAGAWTDGEGGDSSQTYIRLQFDSIPPDIWIDGKQVVHQDARRIDILAHGSMERDDLVVALKGMAEFLDKDK